MQRTLAYARSPAPALPLGFLLGAPWFGLLAALLLAHGGAPAFASRWSTATLGATHLITVGYLGLAMSGSLLQLIPVITGRTLSLGRALAALLWGALAIGALLLAGALAFNASALFLPAAILLGAGFATLLLVAGRALWSPVSDAASAVVNGMRTALAGLAVTVMLGISLALALGGRVALPVLVVTDLHAAWGLLGWVAMLVVGVAFQIIPMFQSSRLYPPVLTRWGPLVIALLLVVWSAAWLAGVAPRLVAIPLAAALAGFAALTWSMMAARKRRAPDATTLYWGLALASLCASALLYLLAPGERGALATGLVFLGGFALGVVNGMLYKIVPFLLWYHLQHDERAVRGQVPPIRDILADAPARRQFAYHCAALAAMLGALWWPVLVLPGAALLALSSVLLACQLSGAGLYCRRIRQQLQPS